MRFKLGTGPNLALSCVFVKFWTKNPIYVYVMRKSCNKTHFCMIHIVWKSFHRFLVVLLLKLELMVF